MGLSFIKSPVTEYSGEDDTWKHSRVLCTITPSHENSALMMLYTRVEPGPPRRPIISSSFDPAKHNFSHVLNRYCTVLHILRLKATLKSRQQLRRL